MNWIDAVILGIVEGITEFLPISSTGHLILADKILGLEQTEFVASFEIAIQLGAILSVLLLYWRRLLLSRKVFLRVSAAFIPTAVLGLIFYKAVKQLLIYGEAVVLASLFLGGIFLVWFEWRYREKPDSVDDLEGVSFKQAVIIGLFQSIAMIPGVSRAAATICGGLILGLKRKTIVEFSFLLAIPTMLAATALDLLKTGTVFTAEEWRLLAIGFAVSFVVALASIKALLHLIRNHSFMGFGFYRIAASALFFFLFF